MSEDWDSLKRARHGDENAWRELFQKYYPMLVRMTALITGSLEVAGDLAQETFVRLLHSRTNAHRGTFKSYVTTIAYRLAFKEKARGVRNCSLDQVDLPELDGTPLDLAEKREQETLMLEAFQALNPRHREILVLRFYGDLSYEEIAQLTGLPLGTVKSRIFNAVNECRQALKQRGIL